jgi:ditrans,polycis-polyprenyl diphosphate synthase
MRCLEFQAYPSSLLPFNFRAFFNFSVRNKKQKMLSLLIELMFKLAIFIIQLGPIPEHIAFIMDGNRRFARSRDLNTQKGHYQGFQNLEETLKWCLLLKVKVITVFAFSIENFKRTKEEVDYLFDLADLKFGEFLSNQSFIKKNNICVRFVGDLDLLRPSTLRIVKRLMWETKDNTRFILNVACPYTFTHEYTTVLTKIIDHGFKEPEITRELISNALFTTKVDILVRTSGEKRLSDFLLFQCSEDCVIYFINCLWPEFTFWHMLPLLFRFQLNYSAKPEIKLKDLDEKEQQFINLVRKERIQWCLE